LHRINEGEKVSKDLSTIVVTWNSAEEVANCLESVSEHACDLDMETFVVDNASHDNTVALIRERFPAITLLVNDQNLGFATASNQAISMASGRNLLLLNPDTIVHRHALQAMVGYLDSHPSVGIVGPRLIQTDGQTQRSCLRFPSLVSVLVGYISGGGYVPRDLRNPSPVQAISGAALMVKRDALAKVGLLDSGFFMYGEDNDVCYRMQQAGWENHYLPTATVTHIGGQSARQVPVHTYVRRHVAKLRFVLKHGQPWEYNALAHLMRLHIRVRALCVKNHMHRYYSDVLEAYDREVLSLDEKNLHSIQRSHSPR
jgi:GT2 family glycosyltransferase